MQVSFTNTLTAASRFLPDEVLTSPVRSALRRIAPLLGCSCSSYYLEWHLSQPERVDLLSSLTHENSDRFIALNRSHPEKTSASQKEVLATLTRWQNLQVQLEHRASHIWLAYDYLPHHTRYDLPNIHYCIDKNFTNRTRERDYCNRLSEKVFNETATALLNATLPEKMEWPAALLMRYYKLLHSLDGEIIHLSFMHSRTPAVAKLNMTIPKPALSELLTAVRWPGDRRSVISLCEAFAPDEKRIKGNICIAESACCRFELELEYNVPLQRDPRRTRMLHLLTDNNLATKHQAKIMRSWPGREDIPYRNSAYTFERWIDCKICFLPDGTVTAKPYFGFAPLPRIGWNRDALYD